MNFLIFSSFITIIIIIIVVINLVECGQNHAVDGIQYYVSYPRTETWYQANRFCAYKNMDLIDVHEADENYRVQTLINKPEYLNLVDPVYWTSGTDLGSENKWYWMTTGQSINKTNFIEGQPTGNHYAENCLVILKQQHFKWDDVRCGSKNFYICRGRKPGPTIIDIQEN